VLCFLVLSLSLLPRQNSDNSAGVYRCKRVSPAGCSQSSQCSTGFSNSV